MRNSWPKPAGVTISAAMTSGLREGLKDRLPNAVDTCAGHPKTAYDLARRIAKQELATPVRVAESATRLECDGKENGKRCRLIGNQLRTASLAITHTHQINVIVQAGMHREPKLQVRCERLAVDHEDESRSSVGRSGLNCPTCGCYAGESANVTRHDVGLGPRPTEVFSLLRQPTDAHRECDVTCHEKAQEEPQP